MILDVIILVILIIPMAIGLHRGAVYMLARVLGWIVAVAAAVFFTSPLSQLLRTGFPGELVFQGISEKFSASEEAAETAAESLPHIVSGGLRVTAESVSDVFAGLLTTVIISIISFMLIIIAVRLVVHVIIRPAAARKGGGLLTRADKLLGMAAGAVEGFILALVFLAFLVPVVSFGGADVAGTVAAELENSVVAGALYDNNLLLLITGGLFS